LLLNSPDSNLEYSLEFLKILLSCADPGHLATISMNFKSEFTSACTFKEKYLNIVIGHNRKINRL